MKIPKFLSRVNTYKIVLKVQKTTKLHIYRELQKKIIFAVRKQEI